MKIKNVDIGVIEGSGHYFILDISKDNIKVYLTYNNGYTKDLQATISIQQWELIKYNVINNFKDVLKDDNYKINRIHKGENKLNVLLGKETILLFWGIEGTKNKNDIEQSLKNWQGLSREERWYLYTMTNANLSKDINKGWRGAVKKILIEN